MTELTPEEEEAKAARARAAEIAGFGKVKEEVLHAVDVLGRDGVFHGYQKEAVRLSHLHELLVIEKGRRTGITWAFAGDDVITASTRRGEGGDDVLYMGPSFDMAREYIDACAGFARAFMGLNAEVEEYLFVDEDKSRPGETRKIQAFRIDFASGFSIVALTSAPRSLRGRQGLVRIDEGAFVDNLKELLKAAIALIMLGSRVVVISTHNGVDNAFNKLIQEIRSGEREGHVLTISFATALADGIYERIATIRGLEKTPEAKSAWVAKIRKTYGDAAAEELDAIPSRSSGSWLSYDLIERAEDPLAVVLKLQLDDGFAFQPDHLRQAYVRDWCEENLLPVLMTLDRSAHGLGGDFARFGDVSFIWCLQELKNRSWRTPFVLEMRNVPYREQEFIWIYILQRIRRWRAKVDAHGNGGYLAERLMQTFGQALVEAVKALSEWWRDQGAPLLSRFQDERILVPRDAGVATDLRMVKVVNGSPAIPAQRTSEKAEDGAGKANKRHGDGAVALFHASAALREGVAGEIDAALSGPVGAPAGYHGPDQGDPYEPLDLSGY
jgi:phage FluMu gp28-like protein